MKIKPRAVIAGIFLASMVSVSFADEAAYAPPPVHAHIRLPSSAAVARKAMKKSDRNLAKRVRAAISAPGQVDMSNVAVLARSGKVTLVGSVPENEQIDLARQRAQSVAGVTHVVDDLTIRIVGH